MRRTVKYPDGREETTEGTPEEFAALDRAARRPALSPPPPEKPAPSPDWWPHPKPGEMWTAPVGTGQSCLFDGLPPGAYMLSCPCPRHGSYC